MNKFVWIITALAVISCGTQKKIASGDEKNSSVVAVARDNEMNRVRFGMDLVSKAIAGCKSSSENVVISPYSAGVALSMLAEGADGDTRKELLTALSNASYATAKLKSSKDYIISSANSVWLSNGFDLNQGYANVLENVYGAQIETKDFMDKSTVREINKWCSAKTSGRIPKIIDEVSPDMVMFLLNALYFKASWQFAFDEESTYDAVFHSPSGDMKTPFMHKSGEYAYGEKAGCRYVILPYKSDVYKMIICLPAKDSDIKSIASGIDASVFVDAISSAEFGETAISLPRFKINTTLTLNNILAEMGVQKAFSSEADFSGITSSSVAVDAVMQKCFIEVNEAGSEAAAVTSVGIRLTSMHDAPKPFIMNVDRPFLFAIFDSSSHDILFAGKISSIEK